MTPARPAAVMSNAIPANTPISVAVSRGAASDAAAHVVERSELIDRLVGIDGVNGVAHLLHERRRIVRCARQEHHRQLRRLGKRAVQHLRRLGRQGALDVADDADDPQPGPAVVDRDPGADGIGLGKELSRHRVADGGDRLAIGDVAVVDQPPAQQRNADSLKVARARRLHFGTRQPRRFNFRLAFNAHAREKSSTVVQRERAGAAGRADTAKIAKTLDELGRELRPERRRRVLAEVEGDAHADDVVGLDAGVDRLQPHHASQHQAGTDEKDEGHSNLRHYQGAAERAPSRGYGAATLLNRGRQADSARERRDRTDEHPRQHGNADGKQQNRTVERDLLRSRRELAREA